MSDDGKEIDGNLSTEETSLRRSPRIKKISENSKTSIEDEDASLKRKTRKRDIEQSIPRRITRSQSNFSKTDSCTEEENTLKLNTIEEETEDLTNTQPEGDSLINQQLPNDNLEERNAENESQDCKLSDSPNTTLNSEENPLEESLINEENVLETAQLDDSKHSDNDKTFTSAPIPTLNRNGKVIDDENDKEDSKSDTEKINDKEKQDNGKTFTSAPVSTLNTNENNKEESKNDTKKIKDKEAQDTINQRYSQLIDSSDIDYKIDELLSVTCTTSDDESEDNHNEFLDSMAEEGEEDTPSEGSNDIIEVGEEINTTESELSTDESYENNSFLDDEEEPRLLSGDEYDLSLEEPKKRSRIIQLDCGSDDEIIKIDRPKRERMKKPRKSRIIRIEDSSDEDVEINVTTVDPPNNKEETVNKDTGNEATTVDPSNNKEETVNGDIGNQVTSNKEEVTNDSSMDTKTETLALGNKEETVIEDIEDDLQLANNKEEITNDSAMDSKDTDKDGTQTLTHRSSTPIKTHETVHDIDSKIGDIDTNNEGPVFVNIAIQIVGQKFNISQNLNIEDTGKLPLSEHVKDIIDTLSSSIDDASEISLKLSAHYLDEKHSINENVNDMQTNDETSNLSENLKKKNNQKVSISNEALCDYFKTVSKPSTQDLKQHQPSDVIVAGKKGTKRKLVAPTNNQDFSEKTPVKKKKKNKKKRHRKDTGNGVQMGILDEVQMASNRNDVTFTDDDWDMEDVAMKPMSFNKSQSQTNNKESKLKLEKNGNIDFKKFPKKDFKNSMLFDSSRVKRMVTKQVLKKRGIQLHSF